MRLDEDTYARLQQRNVSARMQDPLRRSQASAIVEPSSTAGASRSDGTGITGVDAKRADAAACVESSGMVKSKYRAVKTTVDGITFSSKAEAKRYQELKILESAGDLSFLTLQPVFVLAQRAMIQGRVRPALRYIADFQYLSHGALIVEDVKGILTPVYKLKRHLMKAILGIDIQEITK